MLSVSERVASTRWTLSTASSRVKTTGLGGQKV